MTLAFLFEEINALKKQLKPEKTAISTKRRAEFKEKQSKKQRKWATRRVECEWRRGGLFDGRVNAAQTEEVIGLVERQFGYAPVQRRFVVHQTAVLFAVQTLPHAHTQHRDSNT